MTIAKDFASKLAVAFVAVAMIFAAIAPGVQAQETSEDLQKTINDLLAQVASLQGELGDKGAAPSMGSCNFTMDLKTGSTGADVKALQMFLNSDPDTRVAATGVGSAGMETETFGPMTAAAVSKFQVKYRAEILSPAGLVNPTGYFGPGSRAQANKLCAGSDDGDDDDDTDGNDDDDNDNDGELSGEGELSEDFEIDDADDTDVQEGAEDAEIAVLTLEAEDGDIEVSRIDFQLDATTEDAQDVFETISLWVDGDMIAEFDASDDEEYLDEDDGTFRMSGLDVVVMEDEEVEITVAATVMGSVDTLEDWTLTVDEIRYFDADGVATDEDGSFVTGESASFDIVEEGDGEELQFSLGSNSPDAMDVVVDEDNSTDDITLLEYTIEAEEGDIELNSLFVNFVVSGDTYANIVDDVRIVVDGEEFDGETPVTANGSTTVEFDIDGDVTIDADSEITVEVVADINSQDNFANNSTIEAKVRSYDADQTDAEGADDLDGSDISGSADGDEMTLVAEGITSDADPDDHVADASGDNDETGEFEITFEVTAVEGDFYINDLATQNGSTTAGGVEFAVETSGGGVASGISGTLDSSADDDTGAFVVRDGETEEFTLTVTFAGGTAGQFRVVLEEIWYSASDDGTSATLFTPSPESDYRTGYKQVN